MSRILVSACLLGLETRYDGCSKPCPAVLELKNEHILIPVCPEQAGGLSTPRCPSERIPASDRVMMKNGSDVTGNYQRGAGIALKIAELNQVDYCIFKSGSPSCGCGLIYDGTFSGNKIPGDGVTTELLKKHGFRVISEEEL